jgi:hypothetical protein
LLIPLSVIVVDFVVRRGIATAEDVELVNTKPSFWL